MRTTKVDILQRYTPIPIAVLITAANSFDCDIYIKNDQAKVNVKDYDEMKKGLVTKSRTLVFFFDGSDEKAAEGKISKLFAP